MMPGNMTSVTLRPGVNLEPTPALNEAGISDSQLIRTMNGLTQTMGGWEQFGMTVPSTVRDLHCWQDTLAVDRVAAGATSNLIVQTTTGSYQDITPQTRTSSAPALDVSISSGSQIVTIVDPNFGGTVLTTIDIQTPISIGNLLLQGSYGVVSALSTGSFTIQSSVAASTTIASSGTLPIFNTTGGSVFVGVQEANHTAAAIVGLQQSFRVPTSVGGITISGPYSVGVVGNSSSYSIISPTAATSAASVTMNNGTPRFVYYVTTAPSAGAVGYGGGPYGGGGYGTGATPSGEPGTRITAGDWSLDNWGEILIACPRDGPIYQWPPTVGFLNAQIIEGAPLANGGIFISMPQQILVAWKSIQSEGNGGLSTAGTQDNLIVRWSDAQDFQTWDISNAAVAGSFRIPTGSVIRGGLQSASYGVIWTDVDVWIMQFVDATTAFNFTRIGSGCGLIGQHAAGVISGTCMWCSEFNFFTMADGVKIIPCSVWDFIFQNLNQSTDPNGVPYKRRICAAPNSAFSEMTWFFPTPASTENNAYVKLHITDGTWDKGFLTRTAWEDISVVGSPVATDTGAIIWQHEQGNTIAGASNTSFKTGWWAISDGEELAFVDFVMPDFTWGTFGNVDASVQITFFSVDYPGDTPRTYGPFTVTQANQYISPRIRGRLVSMEVKSVSSNVFWRLGRIRFRFAPSGRR